MGREGRREGGRERGREGGSLRKGAQELHVGRGECRKEGVESEI